jgi:hypothetical protein
VAYRFESELRGVGLSERNLGSGGLPLTPSKFRRTSTQSCGTRLVLEHSGFLPGFAFDGAKEGWERMVGELRKVLTQAA